MFISKFKILFSSLPNYSTSLNLVSGDGDFKIGKSLIWLAQCLVSLSVGSKHKSLIARKWDTFNITKDLFELKQNVSPARLLTEFFLDDLHLDKICCPLDILELGPGLNPIYRYSKSAMSNYIGAGFTFPDSTNGKLFLKIDLNEIDFNEFNSNCIFSHSVLEHISGDIQIFTKMKSHLNGKVVFQCHFIPSGRCLMNYFWHGWRVYNLRNISRMLDPYLNDKDYRVEVVGLGGPRANLIYLKKLINRIFLKIFGFVLIKNVKYSYSDFENDRTSNFSHSTYFALLITKLA